MYSYITELNIDKVELIEDKAFTASNIRVIKNNLLKEIPKQCFTGCPFLTHAIFPNVTKVCNRGFLGCTNLIT